MCSSELNGFPKLSSNTSSNNIYQRNYSEALNQSWPQTQGKLSSRKLAILEPLDHQYQHGLFRVYDEESRNSPHPHVSMSPSNLPPLDWRQQSRWVSDEQYLHRSQENLRSSRWSRRQEELPRKPDRESGLKPVLARQTKYPSPQSNGHVPTEPSTPPQPARFVSPVPSPHQLREPSPIAPLVPLSPSLQRHEVDAVLPLAPSSQTLQVEDFSGDNASDEPRSRPPSQVEAQVDTLVVEQERLKTPPPAPSSPTPAEILPDISEEVISEEKSPLSRRRFGKNSGKSRLRSSRGTPKEEKTSSSPEVAPLDNPKEALGRSLQQLEHPEWEVTVQGLQTLIRLTCHHSSLLTPVMHQVVVAVTKHVRNLRSQVARVACKAATNFFTTIGRGIENDMEDLCAVLLSRTADTNKFLRADCNTALDAMVDNLSSTKIVALIVNKGVKHQNAVVRATSCRLLLRLCQRLGPDRVLSLPRETRDAILNTGARSLTEGSLDTRRYAKEMFILLSQDPRLINLLSEVVPTSVMRSISKVLARIIAK